MNSYELMYILKPDMEEEARTALIAQFNDIITSGGGEIVKVDEWGMRRLAYSINYITDGYYVLVDFKADGDLPHELERRMGNSEFVMRKMVTKHEVKGE